MPIYAIPTYLETLSWEFPLCIVRKFVCLFQQRLLRVQLHDVIRRGWQCKNVKSTILFLSPIQNDNNEKDYQEDEPAARYHHDHGSLRKSLISGLFKTTDFGAWEKREKMTSTLISNSFSSSRDLFN